SGLLEPPQDVRRCLRSLVVHTQLERGSVHVLHDDVRPLTRLADVVDGDDAWIAGDARSGTRFTREPSACRVVCNERLREELHSYDASEGGVRSAIDVTHRAVRDPLCIG